MFKQDCVLASLKLGGILYTGYCNFDWAKNLKSKSCKPKLQ